MAWVAPAMASTTRSIFMNREPFTSTEAQLPSAWTTSALSASMSVKWRPPANASTAEPDSSPIA